jgi:hypothetical protein
MSVIKPSKITLRTYQVGFGDCFLLIFEYPDNPDKPNLTNPTKTEKFVLIDFGTTGLPDNAPEDQMLRVAKNIMKRCNANLDVIVATHRHQDHISGFATDGKKTIEVEYDKDGKKIKAKLTTGEIIAECKPKMVIQPWTEDPELEETARDAKKVLDEKELKEEHTTNGNGNKFFVSNLKNMHKVANIVIEEATRLGTNAFTNGSIGSVQPLKDEMKNLLTVLGENNIKNASAVKNLRGMSKNPRYIHYGKAMQTLVKFLPGVEVEVLGPPTVSQYDEVLKQRSKDEEEFWMLRGLQLNYWQLQAETSKLTEEQNNIKNELPDQPFPNAKIYENYSPAHTRWFIHRMREVRAEQLLGIVRILDKAMNNTSVILLFMIGSKKLLFPGDAQIENWEYVLKHENSDSNEEKKRLRLLKLLKDVTLYKVGHHGSRNATPKTLWNKFANVVKTDANIEEKAKSMHTVCSTMAGKHGTTEATKVPRKTLVDELAAHSQYQTTQKITEEYRDNDTIPDDEKGLYFETML